MVCFDEEVEVIGHQSIVEVDGLAIVATSDYMVKGTRKFDTGFTRHGIENNANKSKSQTVTV